MNRIKYKINRLQLVLKYAFLWRKPWYLLRVLKNVLFHRLRLKKTFTLRSLCLAITYACNYNCSYCFTKEMNKKRKREEYLQLDDYKRIADEAMAMGAVSFAFQGGEIWLRKDYKDIIKVFRPKKNYIGITTNGSYINEETIKELKDLGVNTIWFSLESGIAEEHDRILNQPGSFDIAMKALKTALKEKIEVGIDLTLSKKNIYNEGTKKLLNFSNKYKLRVAIIFIRATGLGAEYMLSNEDIEYYNKQIRPLYPYINRDLGYNYSGVCGCAAAKESFYINPWGDVLACPFNHTFFGSLKKDSLKEIQKRALGINWFNRFHPRCLTAEDKDFMKDYYSQLSQSDKGMIDYSFWLKKQKSL